MREERFYDISKLCITFVWRLNGSVAGEENIAEHQRKKSRRPEDGRDAKREDGQRG